MRGTTSRKTNKRVSNQGGSNDLLKRQRLQRGWTQDDVADGLHKLCLTEGQKRRRGDINANMISRWECGKVQPSAFWQAKLLRLYGARAEELGFIESLPQQKEPLPREESSSLPSRRTQEGREIYSANELARALQVLCGVVTSPIQQETTAWLTLGVQHLTHLFDEGWSVEDILTSLQTVLQGAQVMSKISRRHLLQLGATAVVGGIAVPTSSHVSAEDRVHLCEALGSSIAAGWKLFHTASNTQVLAVGQAQLFLLQQSHALLPSRDRAAFYTATYNLIGKAKHLQEHYHEALDAHMNAHIAALSTGDPWHVTQSLICQADTYQSLGQHTEAIEVIEEALRILGNPSEERQIRTKAHLLACWADNALAMGEYTTVQRKLDESASYLDRIGPNEEFDRTSWLQFAGKYALAKEDYASAFRYYQDAYIELPPNWLIRQAFVLIPLMVVYACARDRINSLNMAKKAVTIMSALNAPTINKQLTDSIQQGLLGAFPEDPQVQEFIADLPRQIPFLSPPMPSAS